MNVLQQIHKIAVLRATALGDFIAALPALNALRRTYPDAEIVYLGNPWHKAFLENRPSPIDRVIVIPVSKGVRLEAGQEQDPAELDQFFAAMQQERFDLAIQMHGGGANSNPFLMRLRAKFNVGMCTPDAPHLDRWMPYIFYQNEIARLLELVSLVGAKPIRFEPHLSVTTADRAALAVECPDLPERFVVLHPGASDVRRRWPPAYFAQVGDALAEQGLSVLVTGMGAEREVVEAVMNHMCHPTQNLCDRLSLGGLAALLARAALLVCNDTGPLHLANAVGTPNVGVFWGKNFCNWTHFNRSKHRPLPSWVTHCPICGADLMVMTPLENLCDHRTCLVQSVTPDEVIVQALDLLTYHEAAYA